MCWSGTRHHSCIAPISSQSTSSRTSAKRSPMTRLASAISRWSLCSCPRWTPSSGSESEYRRLVLGPWSTLYRERRPRPRRADELAGTRGTFRSAIANRSGFEAVSGCSAGRTASERVDGGGGRAPAAAVERRRCGSPTEDKDRQVGPLARPATRRGVRASHRRSRGQPHHGADLHSGQSSNESAREFRPPSCRAERSAWQRSTNENVTAGCASTPQPATDPAVHNRAHLTTTTRRLRLSDP